MRLIVVTNDTNQGSRPYQEDYYAHYLPPSGFEARGELVLLADGMGGMAAGSTASLMAVQYFHEKYYGVGANRPKDIPIPELLGRLMAGANEALVRAGVQEPFLRGMGTTLVACAIVENRLYYASVGDSHLYLCRRGELRLLNEDHSVGGQIASMLAQGKLSQEEARQYEGQSHKLVHYLGNKHFSHFDLPQEPFLLLPGDVLILCSDGLYGVLPEADIVGIVAKSTPKTAAGALIKAALARKVPGQDNLTVHVVTFGEADSKGNGVSRLRSGKARLIAMAAALAVVAILAVALVLIFGKPRPPVVSVPVTAQSKDGDASPQPGVPAQTPPQGTAVQAPSETFAPQEVSPAAAPAADASTMQEESGVAPPPAKNFSPASPSGIVERKLRQKAPRATEKATPMAVPSPARQP